MSLGLTLLLLVAVLLAPDDFSVPAVCELLCGLERRCKRDGKHSDQDGDGRRRHVRGNALLVERLGPVEELQGEVHGCVGPSARPSIMRGLFVGRCMLL